MSKFEGDPNICSEIIIKKTLAEEFILLIDNSPAWHKNLYNNNTVDRIPEGISVKLLDIP